MFCLMLVKFLEFPVKDEEKSDRIFKNLFDEHEAQYDLDYCILEAIFIHREITLICTLTLFHRKRGLAGMVINLVMVHRKGEYFI
jgi:hypothetical protein